MRATPKASSGMSFCISPLPDCEVRQARTHVGRSDFPHRRCSSFTTRATHDRHRAVVWFKNKDNQAIHLAMQTLAMQIEDASRDRTCFLVTPLLMSSLRRWPHQFHSAARTRNLSRGFMCRGHSSRRASNCYAREYGTPAVVRRSVGLHARKPKGGYEQSLGVPAACQRMPDACT